MSHILMEEEEEEVLTGVVEGTNFCAQARKVSVKPLHCCIHMYMSSVAMGDR